MKKLIVILFLFVGNVIIAQAPQKFYSRFGGYGHDIGYGIIQTLNGQYAVTGSTSSFGNGNTDVYLALVDSMGWPRWEKSFGGFNNDIGKSIIQLKDSGFVIAGYTNSFGSGGYDMYAIRTDKNGTLIWQKTFGGLDWDFGYCVKEVKNGDSLIFCGSTYSYGYGKSDGFIVKTDINGILQWQKAYGGPEDDEFKSMTLTYNNLYAFAGTNKSLGDIKGDAWIMKTNLSGDSVLSIRYDKNSRKQNINDIEENPNSHNFFICGGYDQYGKDSTSAAFVILTETGTFVAEDFFSYRKIIDEQYMGLTNKQNGEYIYIKKNGYHSSGNRKLEPMVSHYTNNIYLNTTSYGSTEDDELFDICKTKRKGFCMIGYTKGFNANLTDIFLVVIDSNSIVGSTSAVGINDINQPVITSCKVYPSITHDYVTIENTQNPLEKLHVTLYDLTGKIYQSYNFIGSVQADLSQLSEGTYILHISDNQKLSRAFRIIKTL